MKGGGGFLPLPLTAPPSPTDLVSESQALGFDPWPHFRAARSCESRPPLSPAQLLHLGDVRDWVGAGGCLGEPWLVSTGLWRAAQRWAVRLKLAEQTLGPEP